MLGISASRPYAQHVDSAAQLTHKQHTLITLRSQTHSPTVAIYILSFYFMRGYLMYTVQVRF